MAYLIATLEEVVPDVSEVARNSSKISTEATGSVRSISSKQGI
jgi:hypothetical protein